MNTTQFNRSFHDIFNDDRLVVTEQLCVTCEGLEPRQRAAVLAVGREALDNGASRAAAVSAGTRLAMKFAVAA